MLITIFRTKQYDGVSSVAAIGLYSYNDNIGNDLFASQIQFENLLNVIFNKENK